MSTEIKPAMLCFAILPMAHGLMGVEAPVKYRDSAQNPPRQAKRRRKLVTSPSDFVS